MPNDLVQLAAEDAVRDFGGTRDAMFNAAGFGRALMRRAGLKGSVDGSLVRAILCGRTDITVLHGGAHFLLKREA